MNQRRQNTELSSLSTMFDKPVQKKQPKVPDEQWFRFTIHRCFLYSRSDPPRRKAVLPKDNHASLPAPADNDEDLPRDNLSASAPLRCMHDGASGDSIEFSGTPMVSDDCFDLPFAHRDELPLRQG